MRRLLRKGMAFVDGDARYFVRGVTYGPFRPASGVDPFPSPEVAQGDFRRMRELGVNTIRVYHVPPPWLSELAAEWDLRLLVGIPWAWHLRFLDSAAHRAEIHRTIREGALALRSAPNLLGILIGNEISPEIVRWYGARKVERFLSELAREAHDADPEALVSYANFPMTEYLDPAELDFVSFNVYLHRPDDLRRYLGRLQNLADFRPLLLSEFGVDSLREGEAEQAHVLGNTIRIAAEVGCAGTVVFSYTDEWHTGGHDIEDWAFGLVTRDRKPKVACRAVQRLFQGDLPGALRATPKVSVVICAYNAERTMEECLDSLRRLRYPRYEVIVVDDGSTDGTKAIAERYPEFRLISHENLGLSQARNDGILAATGDIVAFTDSDCAADPDWLTYLVERLLDGRFAGVGGPNLPPPEDHWIPEVVARSPGGPTHVLLTDEEAEHIPGCNMAFWREDLLKVGMFDPIYRAAGDDVDLCWRFQDAGYTIGFAPAALVWHRRRATVRAYLRQQRGYGHAEGLLYFKHPYRFNTLGQSRWLGRIYRDPCAGILGRRSVIYSGVLGSGLFQTLYESPASVFGLLPSTFEWNATAFGLVAFAAISAACGVELPLVLFAGLGLLGLAAAHAAWNAMRVDVTGVPVAAWKARGLIAVLNYLGPLLRAVERYRMHRHGLSRSERIHAAEVRQVPEIDWRLGRVIFSYWNGTGIEKATCVYALAEFLRPRKYPVIIDDGWQGWDLSVHRGLWVRALVQVLVQNHGASRRQVNVGVALRATTASRVAVGGLLGAAALAALAGAAPLSAALLAAASGMSLLLLSQARRLGDTVHCALERAYAELPLSPLHAERVEGSRLRRPLQRLLVR
jgi:O-antigen biosynthesis protein